MVFTTGKYGVAAAADAAFAQSDIHRLLTSEEGAEILNAWKRVAPAMRQGAALSDLGLSECCIDSSDGLKDACYQIATASNVNIVLREESVPIHPITIKVAHNLGIDPMTLAVGDSVDFRLVFTVSPDKKIELIKVFTDNNWELYEIGEVIAQDVTVPSVQLQTVAGLTPMPGVAWDQSEKTALERVLQSTKS